jgi:hypothetical protein
VLERGRIGEDLLHRRRLRAPQHRRSSATLCDAIDRRFAADPALAGALARLPGRTGDRAAT